MYGCWRVWSLALHIPSGMRCVSALENRNYGMYMLVWRNLHINASNCQLYAHPFLDQQIVLRSSGCFPYPSVQNADQCGPLGLGNGRMRFQSKIHRKRI